MGVGSGKACSGMQIHPRIPYLEPTSCVVQEEALESLFLSACAPSASAPLPLRLCSLSLCSSQSGLSLSQWNGSTSHKSLLFFCAGLYLQTTGILPPSADCTFLKCRLILIQVCIFITPFKEKCLGMPLSYAGIIDSHYQSRLT